MSVLEKCSLTICPGAPIAPLSPFSPTTPCKIQAYYISDGPVDMQTATKGLERNNISYLNKMLDKPRSPQNGFSMIYTRVFKSLEDYLRDTVHQPLSVYSGKWLQLNTPCLPGDRWEWKGTWQRAVPMPPFEFNTTVMLQWANFNLFPLSQHFNTFHPNSRTTAVWEILTADKLCSLYFNLDIITDYHAFMYAPTNAKSYRRSLNREATRSLGTRWSWGSLRAYRSYWPLWTLWKKAKAKYKAHF